MFWLPDEKSRFRCKKNLKTKSEEDEYLEYNLVIYHFQSATLSELMSNWDFLWVNTASNLGSNITNKNRTTFLLQKQFLLN